SGPHGTPVSAQVRAGQGPDRHLQALRHEAIAGGERLPELFLDPGYADATHFRLCTVQVPPSTPKRTQTLPNTP
ncbi:CPT2 palmitoyltransferase, partial [Nothoprocta pentlandii]|nr:CPT2 palmitoyltransferase [Nothoprocta pentlandii]